MHHWLRGWTSLAKDPLLKVSYLRYLNLELKVHTRVWQKLWHKAFIHSNGQYRRRVSLDQFSKKWAGLSPLWAVLSSLWGGLSTLRGGLSSSSMFVYLANNVEARASLSPWLHESITTSWVHYVMSRVESIMSSVEPIMVAAFTCTFQHNWHLVTVTRLDCWYAILHGILNFIPLLASIIHQAAQLCLSLHSVLLGPYKSLISFSELAFCIQMYLLHPAVVFKERANHFSPQPIISGYTP